MKEINKENKLYFCDSQSGDYFYLDNPQEYVEEITKATISKNNNPIFHSGRGIGNLCL